MPLLDPDGIAVFMVRWGPTVSGWPRWLWPLGRFVNRHKDPFTGRWYWRAFDA